VTNVRLSNGDYLVTDKDVTGFSWPEKELAQRGEAVPFGLQDDLKERTGKYTLADQPFDTYVVENGRLITGRTPAVPRPSRAPWSSSSADAEQEDRARHTVRDIKIPILRQRP
jgi:hypothetical protein